jgi:hypothetical protein
MQGLIVLLSGVGMEPPAGIEPAASSLRVMRSTN